MDIITKWQLPILYTSSYIEDILSNCQLLMVQFVFNWPGVRVLYIIIVHQLCANGTESIGSIYISQSPTKIISSKKKVGIIYLRTRVREVHLSFLALKCVCFVFKLRGDRP